MRKIRTLVVDDEPLARARIIKLLEQFDFITVLGECKNGREALRRIRVYKPDLVFLDIQMPDINGFDVLTDEKLKPFPFIIFVTAFDQYAVKAFDFQAVDYLLKPYDDERFIQALTHAKEQILLRDSSLLHRKMLNILDEYQHGHSEGLTALEFKDKGMIKLLKVNDIFWIRAEGNYLKVHTEKGKHLIRQTLQTLENQLDNQLFIRIHRSILINKIYIEKVKYKSNNQYLFILNNGEKLLSSRSYRDDIIRYLEEREISTN